MPLYTESQVPTPSALAWTVDLSAFDGPQFVVLRTSPAEARIAVVEHLIEIGFRPQREAVESPVSSAEVSEAAVV